ncbi:MAG: RDD family protein [Streptosporangiaceae bacterium]
MTQSPENMGGQPESFRPADPSPGDKDVPPPSVPPPATWHFEPEPVTAGAPGAAPGVPNGAAAAPAEPPNGTPAPYGTSPHYGTPSPGAAPSRGYPAYGTGHPASRGGPSGQEAGLAEWWRRLLARLIDAVVVSIVLVPIAVPLLRAPFHKLEQVASRYPNLSAPGAEAALSKADGKFLVALWILGVVAAAIWFLYDALQHAKWGQTVGKRLLSTRVVTAYDRSPISGVAAAKRAAVYALVPLIPVAGTVFAVINELWLLWDRRRQCLHDKAARTIVIRTDVR